MKKKNGFTLIELLAVIVILAIIALIATPIVLSLISKARKGAAEDTGYGIRKEAQLLYQTTLMSETKFTKIEVDFSKTMTKEGKTYPETKIFTTTNSEGIEANNPFEIDGTIPTNGKVTIMNSGDITYENIVISGYECNVPQVGKVTCGGSDSSDSNNSSNTPAAAPQSSVTITDKSVTNVDVGSTLTLTATKTNTEDEITWTSSDTSVATVSATGVVTGVAAGTTTITASLSNSSNIKDEINIRVLSEFTKNYTQLEYIESSGTQYIDTGIYPKSSTKVEVDFAYNNNDSIERNGWASSGYQEAFSWGLIQKFMIVLSNDSSENILDIVGDTNRHTFELQSGSQKFDGEEVGTDTIGNTATSNQTMYLFALHAEWSNSPINYCFEKIYSVKIYDGDTLVRDFVPARNSSDVVGLYDIVNNVFYTNNGSGSFTAGPAIEL